MRDAPPTPCRSDTSDAPGAGTDAPTAALPRTDRRKTTAADRVPSPFDRERLGWGWLGRGLGGDRRLGKRTD
jgi:hypothetical protein